MHEQIDILNRTPQTLLELATRFAPKVFAALLILLAGYFATTWAARIVGKLLHRFALDAPLRQLLQRIARVLVFGLFVLLALQNLGVELLPLIAGLGIAGAGVALALQGVLGNVAAGLTIIFTRPFKVGEYIAIATVEGEVLEVTLFSTALRHTDQSRVIVPNRKIAGEILHNYGSIRQLDLQIDVAYGTDLAVALHVARDVLTANPRVLQDPAPVILVAALKDSAVRLGVRPWVNVPDFVAATGELNQALVDAFRGRGIVIPLPQREVRVIAGALR